MKASFISVAAAWLSMASAAVVDVGIDSLQATSTPVTQTGPVTITFTTLPPLDTPITTTKAATPSSFTGTNGIPTPLPTQPSISSNCNRFYLVKPGDGCAVVASQNGVSLTDFYSWNPTVGSSCTTLYANVYVCVGVVGSTPTVGNGIATPIPTQPGMVTNCDAFHLVVSGDTCIAIAQQAGISLQQFYAWNPTVGTSCQTLQLGVYVCTSLI